MLNYTPYSIADISPPMSLRLELPPQEGHIAVETRPAETERWLSNLPVLNTAETSHQIFTALANLNRRLLEDKTRLKLLELYRRPVRAVCQELRRQYLGMALPLAENHKLIAERVRRFQVELAYGYKRIVANYGHMERLGTAEKTELALCLQRAISYLTEVLAKSFELYAPAPEGTWREIHQLYRFAEIEGVTDIPVPDALNESVKYSSVSHVYKQALLLDFADPFHLPTRMLDKIQRYLDAYAPLAQLSLAVDSLRKDCQFLINLANDRAGVMNIENTPITTEAQYRLLTTVELARLIHQQLGALQAGQTPIVAGTDKDFLKHQGQEMLLRLITSWGVNPKRSFARSESRGTRFEVAIGIESANFFVNRGSEFLPSTTEVGPQPRGATLGASQAAHPTGAAEDARRLSTLWHVLDEGAGGFSLSKTPTHDEHVRVGDLIASRAEQSDAPWSIAMVRWARSTGPESVEFGVQRLAPSAEAAAVMHLDSPDSNYQLALVLPEVSALRQARTLVTPRGFFKPSGELILDNGYRTFRIRVTKLMNVTGSFEQFQFDYLES